MTPTKSKMMLVRNMAGRKSLPFVILVHVCEIKTEGNTSRTDRANEVNNEFIIWLCWIANCCDFVEKTKSRFHS